MKAAVLSEYHKPFEIKQITTPSPKRNEVLVKVEACGICGSDHFLQIGGFNSTLPIIPGHEASGTIVKLGSEVKSFQLGDRVAIYYIVSCGNCKFCSKGFTNLCLNIIRMGVDIHGAMAEYICVPEENLIPIPDSIGFKEASVLTDAVATPFHALKAGGVSKNDWVMVLGVGGIGSNAIQLAKALGAKVIGVSRSENNIKLAKELGADAVVVSDDQLIQNINEITSGSGVDVVLQCAPSSQMDQMGFACLSNRGKMVVVAANKQPFQLKSVDFIWGEKSIIGSRGFTKKDIQHCFALYQSKTIQINHLTENVLPLEKINQAIDNLFNSTISRTVILPNKSLT
jgi:2-desacetyl-2-hydroxyethyl bacteriochlorophyllide A dehydrogenase